MYYRLLKEKGFYSLSLWSTTTHVDWEVMDTAVTEGGRSVTANAITTSRSASPKRKSESPVADPESNGRIYRGRGGGRTPPSRQNFIDSKFLGPSESLIHGHGQRKPGSAFIGGFKWMLGTRLPLVQNFQSHAFSGKRAKYPLWLNWRPRLGNPGSATDVFGQDKIFSGATSGFSWGSYKEDIFDICPVYNLVQKYRSVFEFLGANTIRGKYQIDNT